MVTPVHDPAYPEFPVRDKTEGSEIRPGADAQKTSRRDSNDSFEDGQVENKTSEKVSAYIDFEG